MAGSTGCGGWNVCRAKDAGQREAKQFRLCVDIEIRNGEMRYGISIRKPRRRGRFCSNQQVPTWRTTARSPRPLTLWSRFRDYVKNEWS